MCLLLQILYELSLVIQDQIERPEIKAITVTHLTLFSVGVTGSSIQQGKTGGRVGGTQKNKLLIPVIFLSVALNRRRNKACTFSSVNII